MLHTLIVTVVLVGNEENIDLKDGLEKIFLDNIIKNMQSIRGKLDTITSSITTLYPLKLFFFFSFDHPTFQPDTYVQYVKADAAKTKSKKANKDIPTIIEFISKMVSGWALQLRVWLREAQVLELC